MRKELVPIPPTRTEDLSIRLHDNHSLDQDEEWCEVSVDGSEPRRLRLHDYAEIYSIPGLYERLFYDELDCRSPQTVRELLADGLEESDRDPSDLRVLDVGAGNGMVGEELSRLGADEIVGVDIIEEAAEATERDRPGLYDDYKVLDLTDIPPGARADLEARRFNCLTSVAALAFGDIPPRAFAEAYNLVESGGWAAFTIKEDFLGEGESSGFSDLIGTMVEEGSLELLEQRRYRHRLSSAGEPLHYVAMMARKSDSVPLEWAS